MIWKPIPNYIGYYLINPAGEVLSARTGLILKPAITAGYLCVSLCKGTEHKTWHIHRLLALTFIPNPKNLPEVNHKDGDKLNNSLENLEWCTYSDNLKHAYKHKLRKPRKPANTKLSSEAIAYIREHYVAWSTGENGSRALAKKFGVVSSYVSLVARGLVRRND